MPNKKGPFTPEEDEFIAKNYLSMSVTDIAKALQRMRRTVADKVKDLKKGIQLRKVEVEPIDMSGLIDLQKKPYWAALSASYSKEELILYQYHWSGLMSQYREDITHSEEMQILKVIDLNILISRNLRERNEVDEQIENLQQELRIELEGNRDPQRVMALNQQISGLRGSQSSRTKEYNDMVQRQQAMLRDLKSTRDQRIDNIESGKVTFYGWLKLHNDVSHRLQSSRQAELIRLAMNREKERLSDYHKYEDGELDQPLLTPETLKEDNT